MVEAKKMALAKKFSKSVRELITLMETIDIFEKICYRFVIDYPLAC